MPKKQKSKRKKTTLKPSKPQIAESFFSRHPVWVTLSLLCVLLLIFYHQIFFQGLTFQGSDSLNTQAVASFPQEALKRGIFPQWCPYVFSGMPSYGSLFSVPLVNLVDYAIIQGLNAIHKILPIPMFLRLFINYVLFGALMYLFLRERKIKQEACLFAALAVVFLPQFIAFTAFGHNTKFLAVVIIPLIFYLTDRLFRKPSMIIFASLALAIGFQLMRVHIQVTYYTFLMLAIYYIFKSVLDIKDKKGFKSVFTNGGLLAGSIVTAFMLAAILYLPVYDYQRFSIRGGGVTGGLDFNYASSWSFHPLEMVTFLIPSFMGFAGQTYWGKMPWTDYPLYMGIVVLMLAGVAFVIKRDRFTWLLGIVAAFSLVVSFGRYFGILYKPMYNWLPFFDKFRVPSMIHILLDICVVALAGVGLDSLMHFRDQTTNTSDQKQKYIIRYFYIFFAIIGLFLIFILLAKGTFYNMIAGSRTTMNEALRVEAYKMAVSDALKALFLAGFAMAAIIVYLRRQIGNGIFISAIIALVVIDLWWVDFKIINPGEPANPEAYFAKTPVIERLKSDESLYRLYPLYDDKQGNWYMSHFIQNVTGYHAAKLRIYQDFIEETGLIGQGGQLPHFLAKYGSVKMQNQRAVWVPIPLEMVNPALLTFHHSIMDMLNVKYITSYIQIPDTRYRLISDGPPLLYENTTALPRAFFVDSVTVLTGRERIFNQMRNVSFDPRKLAILEEKPNFVIEPAAGNTVSVTNWDIHDIYLEAQVEKPTLLVLSEIYYPAGWKAYIDGVETKIHKTNYILRSIFLKPGNHTIKFEFAPKSFTIGFFVSLGTLLILLGAIVASTISKGKANKHVAKP